MKKILAMILALSMLLSVGVFAGAEGPKDLKGQAALDYCMEHLDDESFDAYERIGSLYREGLDGITRDYQEAISWYKKGIDAGKAPSSAGLGYMYLNGFGIERDYEAAQILLERAAEQGDGTAMYLLGTMYELGTGVEKDDWTALSWYQDAADAGNRTAELKVGEYCLYVADDKEKGLEIYNRLAEEGVAEAYAFLGDYSWTAEGPAAAKSWYEKGAALGDGKCMYMLGGMYDTGSGVQKSYTTTVDWYEKAVALGETEAMSLLADLYFYGAFGITKPDRARYLYTESAARGDPYSLRTIAYKLNAKPETGYDSSKDEVTRALELYGKSLACFYDQDNMKKNAWHFFTFSDWDVDTLMGYIKGMVDNHVCDQETSDRIINEQLEHFRLD